MSLSWTSREVAAGVEGSLIGGDVAVTSVTTDSRDVAKGSLFVALHGERLDGHRFAEEALAAGAAAVMVEPGFDLVPRVEVPDTGAALRDLAAMRRRELTIPVVAVTGSTGKTSTKDLLAAALPDASASLRSFNNEVGVPLTILGTTARARYLVVEVGSRGVGHITWLMPAVRPAVAVITNLGVTHLESFGTEERLADAKWELVEGLDERGTAVVPVDEPRLHRSHAGSTLTFGYGPTADVSVSRLEVDDQGRASFDLSTPSGRYRIRMGMAGAHQAVNAAAAVAAGLTLDIDLETLCHGLERATPSPWRMEIHRGRCTVVNDAYNANPDSMVAALRTVASMPGRHIAVLGRMAELGPVETEEHRRVGVEARRLGFTAVVTVGSDPGLAIGAGDIAHPAATLDAAEQHLVDIIEPGDVVLVKASRAVGLEALAERLTESVCAPSAPQEAGS